MSKSRHFRSLVLLAFMLLVVGAASAVEHHPVVLARQLIAELRLEEAEKALDLVSRLDTSAALERGKLLLFSTRYEQAQEILERPDVAATEEGERLLQLARDCARSMAGAFVVEDRHHEVVVRMQDDRDQVLVPFISEVVHASRASLLRGLGVELPRPMRIELVRDHFALAAMTGLPEEAARTTGTVAIANWGRVTMLTPRSMASGYAWLDTLAHELTHVALTIGTRDRAPLWLQEGVAKTFEKRWRLPDAYDDFPSAHALASRGYELGLAREFNDLGASVALMPTPRHALVVYAQMESFLAYLIEDQGDQVLVEMVPRIREARSGDGVDEALLTMTGRDLVMWQRSWRVWLGSKKWEEPPQLAQDEAGGAGALVMRNVRLGRLLLEHGHEQESLGLLETARDQLPEQLQIRYLLAKAHMRRGRIDDAWRELERVDPPMHPYGQAFSLRGRLQADRGDPTGAETYYFRGISTNPWDSEVACEHLSAPKLPFSYDRDWLCRWSRQFPRD